MTITATKTYYVGVIERAIAYYEVEAEDARTAAENWHDGEFSDRDDEALESQGPCNVREQQPDGTWRLIPPSEWEGEVPAADAIAPQLLAPCRMVVERWEHGDLAEAARACAQAITEAEMAMPPADSDPATKPFSVLLLYPDRRNDGGEETYYAWVEAPDPITAIALAQRKALATNEWDDIDPTDFHPLLVIQGHHYGQPMSNQSVNHQL